jgi:hypothetical protein
VTTLKTTDPVGPWRAQHLALYFGRLEVRAVLDLIDTIADAGFNMLVLQPGATMKFEKHPELARPGVLARRQMQRIVRHARDRSLEVVPVLQCMSHGSEILHAYPQYQSAGSDEIYAPRQRGLFRLMFDLLDEMIEVFEGPRWLHIGHDEILNHYNRRYRTRVLRGDGAKQYAESVQRLHGHLAKYSIGTMMWADGLLDPAQFQDVCFYQTGTYGGPPDHFEKAMDLLPRDIVMCDWHYELAREFPTLRYLQNAGFQTMGCSGFPLNTALFSRYALEHRTPRFFGMMVTAWHALNRANAARLSTLVRESGKYLRQPQKSWRREPLLRQVAKKIGSAGQPVPQGKSQRVYEFGASDAGAFHSLGWQDLRYRECPLATTVLKGPRYPSGLQLRGNGRDGSISYEWLAEPNCQFEQVKLRVWMNNPGGNRLEVLASADARPQIVLENQTLRGRSLDLSPYVKGKSSFRLRFWFRNDKKRLAVALRRFEMEFTTRNNS